MQILNDVWVQLASATVGHKGQNINKNSFIVAVGPVGLVRKP